jgi:aryl carrier-like protein
VAVASGGTFRESALAAPEVEAVLKAVEVLLAGKPARGRVELTLSHQLAPVWLIPPAPVRLNWQETQGWVQDRLGKQFGELASTWRIAWEAAPAGEPILASGVDAVWLDGLIEGLREQGVRLQHVRPWLAVACNRHRKVLAKGAAWLALAETGRLTLAGFEDGRLQTLRSSTWDDAPGATLAGMLTRESLLGLGGDSRRVWLQAVHVTADWRGHGGDLDVRELSPASAGLAMMMES